jgi:hypothetical protein
MKRVKTMKEISFIKLRKLKLSHKYHSDECDKCDNKRKKIENSICTIEKRMKQIYYLYSYLGLIASIFDQNLTFFRTVNKLQLIIFFFFFCFFVFFTYLFMELYIYGTLNKDKKNFQKLTSKG